MKPKIKGRKASLDNILFSVEQVPVKEAGNLLNCKLSGQYHSVIYSPALDTILNFTGSQYQLTSNEELVMPIHEKLEDVFGSNGFTTQCYNEDNRRFNIQFILNERDLKLADKDSLKTMIEVQNSYDGTIMQSIGISYWRQICSNGMMGWKRDTMIARRHSVKELQEQFDVVMKKLDNIDVQLRKFQTLTDRTVTRKELDGIMERIREQKNREAFPKRIIEEVPAKIYQEAHALDREPNAWLVYNGFNYFLNHDERINAGMDTIEAIDRRVLTTIHEELHLN